MKIKISPFLLVLIIVFIVCDNSIYIIPVILSATLHEFGHIFAIKLCGGDISKIHILPFGAQITLANKQNISYIKEIFIASAGVIVNLILFVLMLLLSKIIKSPLAPFTAACNMVLFFMNLVPIYPLDGGRIIFAALLIKLDIVIASIASDIISFVFLLLLIGFGVYILIITGYNFSLLLIGIYLLVAFIIKSFF